MNSPKGGEARLQCVVLMGGLGTRLGALAQAKPKPLLPVSGMPFAELLIGEARRRGFVDFLLLAGHLSECVMAFLADRNIEQRFDCRVHVSVEPCPLGTGGALVHSLSHLANDFLLLNGDTWFDFNWLDLFATGRRSGALARLALREVAQPDRYETVEVAPNDRVVAIYPRRAKGPSAAINGGVYYLKRQALDGLTSPSSLEADLLPGLAVSGQLAAKAYGGYFIDIGLPETLAAANEAPARLNRPAVILMSDRVVAAAADPATRDEWIAVVKALNDQGRYVFVFDRNRQVSADTQTLRTELAAAGAYVDDWRFGGTGQMADLFTLWPIKPVTTVVVGDCLLEIETFTERGARGVLIGADAPFAFLREVLGASDHG